MFNRFWELLNREPQGLPLDLFQADPRELLSDHFGRGGSHPIWDLIHERVPGKTGLYRSIEEARADQPEIYEPEYAPIPEYAPRMFPALNLEAAPRMLSNLAKRFRKK